MEDVERDFIEKISLGAVEIVAIPNSRKKGISFDSKKNKFQVSVKSKPENNSANEEIELYLTKIVGKGYPVKIITGKTSKKKLVHLKR